MRNLHSPTAIACTRKHRELRWFFTLMTVALFTHVQGCGGTTSGGSDRLIHVDPPASQIIDLGRVALGETVVTSVRVRNDSATTQYLDPRGIGCNCLEFSPKRLSLEPGEEAVLQVKAFARVRPGKDEWKFGLYDDSNTELHVNTIWVEKYDPAPYLEHAAVNFGSLTEGMRPDPVHVKILNASDAREWRITGVESDTDTVTAVYDQAQESIIVTLASTDFVSQVTGSITVRYSGSDTQAGQKQINVYARQQSSDIVTPSTVDLGVVRAGETTTVDLAFTADPQELTISGPLAAKWVPGRVGLSLTDAYTRSLEIIHPNEPGFHSNVVLLTDESRNASIGIGVNCLVLQ